MNKYVTSYCILPLQYVVFVLTSGSTIINNDFLVGNMRICQACNKEKWPVDEHGIQQACLSEECIKKVLCIIEDLHEDDRTRILLGYAFAIQRRAELMEDE